MPKSSQRRSRASRRAMWASLLPFLVLLFSACARPTTLARVSGARYRIRNIHFEGNEALSDKQLLEHMNLSETRWFPLPDRHYFLEGLVPVDRRRIEDLYDAHGYYDARVVSITPRYHRRRDVVDLMVTIDEGAPTVVRDVAFRWPAGSPGGPADRRATPRRIQAKCELMATQPFDVAELEACESAMRAALRARGYAFAEVDAHAEVDTDRRVAEVSFVLRPGRFVRIGGIRIEGLENVPEELVRVEVERFEGKPFSPRRLENIEKTVAALDAFSSVVVRTAEAPDDHTVGVIVEVSEADFQSVNLGLGFGVDPRRWEQYGAARYSHVNLFGNLTRLDLRLKAGWGELPTLYRPDSQGPVIELEPRIRKKGFLERGLVWTAAPKLEVGIQPGYQFWSVQTEVGVSRFFTRFLQLGLSHRLRYVDFFMVDPDLDAQATILGPDFRDPYLVSLIEPDAHLYLTDRLIEPRHGVVLGVIYDLAGGIFGGQFDFHKITPEIRAYWTPIRRRLQLAARAQAGFIIPFGDEAAAPIDLKYYLGGPASVRGWGIRQLSPVVQTCEIDGTCTQIPVGGDTMVLGSFETRVRVWRQLWVVAFFDVGDVQPEPLTVRPAQWSYTAGPGLRLHTRIGVFRLDLGLRLNDQPERYGDQPRWALHFGLGEAF